MKKYSITNIVNNQRNCHSVVAAPDIIFRKTRPMFVINQRNAFSSGSNNSGISSNHS